jgi:hypothetical protein
LKKFTPFWDCLPYLFERVAKPDRVIAKLGKIDNGQWTMADAACAAAQLVL